MASKVTSVTSMQHFRKITGSSTYTVVDFYADWCGPCKVISPVFEGLASAEAKPGRIAFAKVNVDSQQEVASQYGVSAMPTFLILKGTSVKETIRGANAAALRTAVLSAAADAAKGPAKASAAFTGSGQTLGSASGKTQSRAGFSAPGIDFNALLNSPASFSQGQGLVHQIIRFLGLYVTTLFSSEAARSADQSPFAFKSPQGHRAR